MSYGEASAAVSSDNVEWLQRLISRGFNVNMERTINSRETPGFTLLHEAADDRSLKTLSMIIKNGGNVNAKIRNDNTTPLDMTIDRNYLEAMKILVDNGARLGLYKISDASPEGQRILRGDRTPSYTQPSPDTYPVDEEDIYYTMTYHNYDEVESGGTPLHKAASNVNIDETRRLLESGADINATDKFGNNILHTVLLRTFGGLGGQSMKNRRSTNLMETIRYVLDYKDELDINHQNNYGHTPLYYAARYDRDIFSFLLEEGSDIHLLDNKRVEFGDILNILDHYIKTSKECETGKLNMKKELEQMGTEVSDLTEKVELFTEDRTNTDGTISTLTKVSRGLRERLDASNNNLASCITRKDQLQDLLRQSESLLETRNRTIRECEDQKSELEQDVASISARLLMENSELSDDVIEARDRLRLALDAAARNSNSVQLGSLIKEMSDFMNSGDMNNYQLSVMESIMEENIRQATSPDRIELLRIIFVKIKDEVHDRNSSIKALKELESNDFKVGVFTKIGAHLRLF